MYILKNYTINPFFYLIILLFFIISCNQSNSKKENNNKNKPNILVILMDDMGYSDVGCFGGNINTPNIDKLAREGLRFRQFYNAGRCCPTRASLLTGLYNHSAGMGWMTDDIKHPSYRGFIDSNAVTIAEALKSANYKRYLCGKWHVGSGKSHLPPARGFNKFFGNSAGPKNYFKINKKRPLLYNNDTVNADSIGDFYYTNLITDTAIAFLEDHHQKHPDKPFFFYLAHFAPHWPVQAPKKAIESYIDNYKNGWEQIRKQRYRKMKEKGIIKDNWKLSSSHKNVPSWESLSDSAKTLWTKRMAIHAAMIDIADKNIGRLLDKVKELGYKENTLVVFLSDNGASAEGGWKKNIDTGSYAGGEDSHLFIRRPWANASNTPYRFFKSYAHEGGVATPFIARWPKEIKEKGSIKDVSAHVIDLMPTFLDIANASYPDSIFGNPATPLHGKSLLPFLKGKDEWNKPRKLFWEHEGKKAVRYGKWKLVSKMQGYWADPDAKKGPWKLYNMNKDRSETNDLSKAYPQKVDSLKQMYHKWAEKHHVLPHHEHLKLRKERLGRYGW